MSVNLNLIRVIKYSQSAIYNRNIVEGRYYEVITSGWPNGSRNRIKRFSKVTDVFAYFNKLHIGSWISDDAYDTAYRLISEFDDALYPVVKM